MFGLCSLWAVWILNQMALFPKCTLWFCSKDSLEGLVRKDRETWNFIVQRLWIFSSQNSDEDWVLIHLIDFLIEKKYSYETLNNWIFYQNFQDLGGENLQVFVHIKKKSLQMETFFYWFTFHSGLISRSSKEIVFIFFQKMIKIIATPKNENISKINWSFDTNTLKY